jgi:hypothetical protein
VVTVPSATGNLPQFVDVLFGPRRINHNQIRKATDDSVQDSKHLERENSKIEIYIAGMKSGDNYKLQ